MIKQCPTNQTILYSSFIAQVKNTYKPGSYSPHQPPFPYPIYMPYSVTQNII